MEIDKALSQISEIHEHVTRAEVYRDVKALPVALSGVVALLAASIQRPLIGPAPGIAYIVFWLGVASVCILCGGWGIARDYVTQRNALGRRRTHIVIGQFVPCLAAGMLVTLACLLDPTLLPILPGLWALLFSLGVFAARPYLPRMIGYGALYYLGAGGVLLALAPHRSSLDPWAMGLTFGIGHILTGLILYWNLERGKNGQA